MTNQKEKKTTQLKKLINQPSLNFLMESHNGLSAKIVVRRRVYSAQQSVTGLMVKETKTVFMPSLLFPLRNSVRFIYQHDE